MYTKMLLWGCRNIQFSLRKQNKDAVKICYLLNLHFAVCITAVQHLLCCCVYTLLVYTYCGCLFWLYIDHEWAIHE